MKISEANKTFPWPAFIIVAVAFAVYANTLPNGFVYDDNGQVLKNPWIRDIKFIPDIFSSSVWSFQRDPSITSYYRPMMHIVYMINYHLFGLKPWGFHLVNILMHAAVSLLVFLVISRLIGEAEARGSARPLRSSPSPGTSAFISTPFVAAILFAAHPIHTEVVAWIAAIPELSFTLFSLLSFHLFLKSEDGMNNVAFSLSVGSFSLALLCKETAAALILIFAAYDLAVQKPGRSLTARAARYLPFLAVIGIYLVARRYALGTIEPMAAYKGVDTYRFLINTPPLFSRYLGKLLFPVNLNAFHFNPPISSLFETESLIGMLVSAAFVLLGIFAYRKNRTAFFCLALIAIPLLPAFYVPAVSQAPFSERYLYFPSVGFVFLVAQGFGGSIGKTARSRIVPILLISALAGAYALQTIGRNPVWKNDLTLFSDIVKKSPDAELPNGMLGLAFMNAGKFDNAVEQFKRTLILNPNSENAHYNLGLTYFKKGLPAAAIPEFEKTLALTPHDSDARWYLSQCYASQGMTEKAVEQLRRIAASNTATPERYLDLGVALRQQGLEKEAIESYRKALAIDPGYAEAHFNLGIALADSGQADAAIQHHESAVRLRPGNAFFRNMLGIAYGQKGTYGEAVAQFEEAVRLAPSEPAYRRNLERARRMKNTAGGDTRSPKTQESK